MRIVIEHAAGCRPDCGALVPNTTTVEAIEAARFPFVRTVKQTTQFPPDFKRVERSVHSAHLDALERLAADVPLPSSCVDHPMKGQYNDCCDCHLPPDLLLVYRKRDTDIVELIRIGTHAQLATLAR